MAPKWIKASRSNNQGQCVEVARLADGRIGVRDSKDSEGPVLVFSEAEWSAFLDGAQRREFDNI